MTMWPNFASGDPIELTLGRRPEGRAKLGLLVTEIHLGRRAGAFRTVTPVVACYEAFRRLCLERGGGGYQLSLYSPGNGALNKIYACPSLRAMRTRPTLAASRTVPKKGFGPEHSM